MTVTYGVALGVESVSDAPRRLSRGRGFVFMAGGYGVGAV
jgi:hypothetical protein